MSDGNFAEFIYERARAAAPACHNDKMFVCRMYINICAGVHTKSARNIIVMLAHIIYKYECTHIGIHNVHMDVV